METDAIPAEPSSADDPKTEAKGNKQDRILKSAPTLTRKVIKKSVIDEITLGFAHILNSPQLYQPQARWTQVAETKD